jgi:2-dehydropantoate 2-reductase
MVPYCREQGFLLRRDYQAILTGGLRVTSPCGDFHLPQIAGFRNSVEIGPVDLVLIGLKATANAELVDLVRPLVGPETILLTLQNGLGNEELLAVAFGADRVVGGIAFLCCNRGEPGTVHHLDQGAVRLAELQGDGLSRVECLATLFKAAGIPCEACRDLMRIRWEKLVWNIPFNGLCALTGLATDRLLACPETQQLIEEMMREVVMAANQQGLSEPIDRTAFVARMIQATSGMGAYRPSMMIDRLEARPLELEAIYGIPLARAESKGCSMPRVAMLQALLQVTENPATDGE